MQSVDVYLADLAVWNGFGPNGRPGFAKTPARPQNRPGVGNVVPTISVGSPWSQTIGAITSNLQNGQQIERLYMMGHGEAGKVTIGKELAWSDDAAIAQFQQLRPFARIWATNVYIVGCESAADGPCVPAPVTVNLGGKLQTVSLCVGQFSGNTQMPGYLLLRKLADAINAPVHGSTWKLPIDGGWDNPLGAAQLTVGPGGGWTYSAYGMGTTRFGSP